MGEEWEPSGKKIEPLWEAEDFAGARVLSEAEQAHRFRVAQARQLLRSPVVKTAEGEFYRVLMADGSHELMPTSVLGGIPDNVIDLAKAREKRDPK